MYALYMCVYLCVSACMYFISSSLQLLPTVIIQTDLPTIATASGVIPQDLLIRKCDHRGCKIVQFRLFPHPHSSGLSIHHPTTQAWPPFTASFAEYSFSFVRVVAGGWGWVGGGAGFIRSDYSQTGRNIYGEILPQRTPWMEVLGGPDYICQGNETEQKLSNVMLFERILHVLNNAPFQQANRDIFL